MVHSCCMVGCTQRQNKEKGISLYRIPNNPEDRRKQWINVIRRQDNSGQPWTPKDSARVCSLHFLQDKKDGNSIERYKRAKKRKYETTEESVINTKDADAENAAQILLDMSASEIHPTISDKDTQTNSDYEEIISELQRKLADQVQANRILKSKIQKQETEITRSKFCFNNLSEKEIVFYTGISHELFLWVLDGVSPTVKPSLKKLSMQDHLLLILMKLRLGLLNKDLSYRFRISETAVSRILNIWIPKLAESLQDLIIWPMNDITLSNLPESFKPTYKKVVSIIDCFEVFIERPHNLTARAQTWSNYKHNNTIKYLVSITPSGAINFMSKGWGGRASDKVITVKSGYLENLSHGDEVLADRGFLVIEELAAKGAILHMPSFTKGKKQLSAMEVNASKRLSNVRIHVERVIGKMRNYLILQSTIAVNQVKLLDSMVTIIAALTNLLPSVVPS